MKSKIISLFFLSLIGLSSYGQTNYDNNKMIKEKLGRGLVALREDSKKVFLSWRYLSTDNIGTSFNVYRDGKMIANVSSTEGTFYQDNNNVEKNCEYRVVPVVNGIENNESIGIYNIKANSSIGYIDIPLDRPADGITPTGEKYTYNANDASIGDVDGDGVYEYILKWDPSNSKDNSQNGYTGNVFIDCYRLTGEKLWRIDLGKNIRAGAHYTQIMVYDLDGDGRSEVYMRTSDGTIDGCGNVIGDKNADYRVHGDKNQGRILTGNEFLTVFDGLSGKALKTVDYIPERGNLADWGDTWANRSDRFLAAVAYLDGKNPSVVFCRGYYTRAVLAAYDWNGKDLSVKWIFDSNNTGCEKYAGQGNHNLRVADIDKDGCDEIVYGSCTIDHDGTGLYSTGMGHGDALHLTQFVPDKDALQVWACHENKKDGASLRDAATGKVIFQMPVKKDVGRCMAADIDPENYGVEMFAGVSKRYQNDIPEFERKEGVTYIKPTSGILNYKGETIAEDVQGLSNNMAVWWDGDLLRELLDKNVISKYDWKSKKCNVLKVFEGTTWNNGTKSNPCLQGDFIGDWREEVLMRTSDNSSLRLYVSTIPTEYRFYTFLEDPVYRISIATQNVAYNQPTQPGFYFGPDLKGEFRGYIFNK